MESYDRDILPVDSDRDSSIDGSIDDNDDDSIDSCPDYSDELGNFTSNYGLWRYLVRVNDRHNFANESRIMTILTIAGAWGGQRHVWTFHEHPLRHFYIYNPSKVPSCRNLTYPSAVWFSDAIVPFLGALWANYEHHMNRIIDSVPTLCEKCETRTCWRVIPHVELSDFTNRPILESWAHFTRRDTPRMLNFIVQMARSSLLTRCECSSCRAEIVADVAAAVRCDSTITTTTYNGDDKSLFIPDEVTFDCDFVARHMYKSERQLEKMRDEIQTWHIGNIGCVIRWLLAEGCIDSHRYIEEIDDTFSRLFRIGCIGLAVPFGMYASRRCVVSAVRRFVNTHQEMTSRSCYNNDDARWPCEDTICSCLRGVTSVKTITALHMLAVARNVTLPPLCRYANIVNRGRLCYARVYVETVINYDDDTLLGSVSPAETTGSTDLSALALRSIFINFGVNGTHRLTPQFALSPVRKTLFEKATRHRVLLICNRLFVRIFLQDADSFLWGDSLLLGHCNPCRPNRPIGNPHRMHIPRYHELSDVSREHFFSRLRRQYPPR